MVYLVYEVFENVATYYDKMNDVMSFGIHRLWKDLFVKKLNPLPSTKVLDAAGGTGDIAFRILKRSALNGHHGPTARDYAFVTVVDINADMLRIGQQRGHSFPTEYLDWVRGNAEDLPFENDTFDAYTIAFGIRNCTHVDYVIKEAHRVLKPGGRFMCLEFSKVNSPVLSKIYDWYSFKVIPVMGSIVANDRKSYRYLVESIRRFPDQETFKRMIVDAGFSEVTYTNLSNGIAAIHSGFKLK
ncbi:unnamed protein product [Soboliphyme baturini]|uniref:2-methoxy-6-polyprenyl-1,4-benzoquinol methylase, mitochondrial n=1 Tax=Soboliphyme baturini TaxID=241478 RepID=A0A183IYR4_9BILA|nr:unnamed protein product [Soboliphyme baturini]